MPAVATGLYPSCTPLVNGEPARSPFFCIDLLHHLDLKVALSHELLQPRVLEFQLSEALDVVRLHFAEALAPRLDRLFGYPVLLGDRANRVRAGLTKDRHDLLVRKSALAHPCLRFGRAVSQVILDPKTLGQVRCLKATRPGALLDGGAKQRFARS
jgi:hypothetical protein